MAASSRFVLLGVVAVLATAGCGGSDPDTPTVSEEGEATIKRSKDRIAELESQLEAARRATDSSASTLSAGLTSYDSVAGGWSADVPTGPGWTGPDENQLNPGLHRTEFRGPQDAVLIVDSTPGEPPVFLGEASRRPFQHPVIDDATELTFRGESTLSPCETSACVDLLLPHDGGGFAVLAGGSDDFVEVLDLGRRVARSLRPE